MATSTCGKCGFTSFEIKEVEPKSSRIKMYFVQCASCGVPVASIPFRPTNELIDDLAEKLKKVARAVGAPF